MKPDPLELRTWRAVWCHCIGIVMLAFLAIVLLPAVPFAAQQPPPETHRKVVRRIVPEYPEIARPMKLSGIVRVAASVAPNGSVVSANVLGGHPLLGRVAVDAVRQWRFEAAPQQTEEVVFITFHP